MEEQLTNGNEGIKYKFFFFISQRTLGQLLHNIILVSHFAEVLSKPYINTKEHKPVTTLCQKKTTHRQNKKKKNKSSASTITHAWFESQRQGCHRFLYKKNKKKRSAVQSNVTEESAYY